MVERKNEYELLINGKLISFTDKIKNVIEIDNITIILVLGAKYEENNVRAYDKNGDEIWKINDILKVKKPSGFDEIEKKTDTILQAYCINGIMYEIDVSNKRVLNRTILR